MSKLVLPPDLLVTLVSPESDFDQRKSAITLLVEWAWLKGWEACSEDTERLLIQAGMPVLSVPVRVQ